MEQIKKICQVSYKDLFKVAGISSATYRRWKNRIKNALDPVFSAGPKPVKPLDLQKFHAELGKLQHNNKRSRGVGVLRKIMQGALSRRELDLLIAKARWQAMHVKKTLQHEVDWRYPGTVWAMDVFEMKFPLKVFVLTVQDLASGYKFPPLACRKQPRGKEVAIHLQSLFTKFGKPLFLKLDNGGNLNHSSVMDLLATHLVLPLNSPAYYPPYNGAIEHTQREFKEQILACQAKVSSFNEFARLVETIAHDLNHAARRKKKGLNSCLKFFGKTKRKFSKRKRKEVFEWIYDLAIDIGEKSGQNKNRASAWRIACRKWLEKNGLVAIRNSPKVLPAFFENFAHN